MNTFAMPERSKALALRLFGFVGLLTFGAMFALTFSSPIQIERTARGFIEQRLEDHLAGQLLIARQSASRTRLANLAGAMAQQHAIESQALRSRAFIDLKKQIAVTVSRMQDSRCTCREGLDRLLDDVAAFRIAGIDRAAPQLQQLIEGRYSAIVTALIGDLRLFSGANLAAFAILLLVSMANPERTRTLFVPAILLGVSATVASAFYLFGQNWFFTILQADYVGYGYAVWMLLIFGFLSDIAFFRARVTMGLLNAISGVSPC